MFTTVSHHWYHDPLLIWPEYWWPRRYILFHPTRDRKLTRKKLCPWAGSWSHSSRCSLHWAWQRLCLRSRLQEVHTTGQLCLRRRSTLRLHLGLLDGKYFLYLNHSLSHKSRFNLLGQVAVTTGISFGLAQLISTTATVKSSYTPTPGKTIGIYAAVLISHGAVNTFGVHVLRYLNNTSILLHSVGVTSIAIAVLAKAPTHQSAKFVFSTFYDGTSHSSCWMEVSQLPRHTLLAVVLS